MSFEQWAQRVCGAVVRFGNKNGFCKALAMPALFVGWGETTLPESAMDIYPRHSHTTALVRLGLAALLLLAAVTLGIILLVNALSGGSKKEEAMSPTGGIAGDMLPAAGEGMGEQPPEKTPPLVEDVKTLPYQPEKTPILTGATPTPIPYSPVKPTVQVNKPAEAKAQSSACVCEKRCSRLRFNTQCSVCKAQWESCAFIPAVKSYTALLRQFQELGQRYEAIAGREGGVDKRGCIINQTSRDEFIRDFELLLSLANELEDSGKEKQGVFARLGQNNTYFKLEYLYELMLDYTAASPTPSLKPSPTPSPTPTPTPKPTPTPTPLAAPVCKTTPDAGGLYCVYANGFPVAISGGEAGTTITWAGGSHTYTPAQQGSVAVFGGAENRALTKDTSVTMTGGTVKAIFGGGNGAAVNGKATVAMTGGQVLGDVYGGGNGSAASVTGADITVSGGTIKGNLFGGGVQGKVNGHASISLSGTADIGTQNDPLTGHVTIEGYQGAVSGNRSAAVQGAPVVRGGIRLSSLTDKAVEIAGRLTGKKGSILLSSPANTDNGAVVARATDKENASADPFHLPGFALYSSAEQGAVFLSKVLAIALDGDGGIDSTLNVQLGELLPLSIPLPTRENHAFLGYYSEKEGKGTQYYDKKGNRLHREKWLEEQETTFYAHWELNRPTLDIDPNGGVWEEGNSLDLTFTEDAGTIKSIPDPTLEDHLFSHWQQTGSGGSLEGKNYRFGPGNGHMKLTAQWLENEGENLTTSVTDETGLVSADGLAQLFDAQDLEAQQAKIEFNAVTAAKEDDVNLEIMDLAGENPVLKWFDFTITKTVTQAEGSSTEELTDLPAPITIIINLTGELAGMEGYAVYRYHGGAAQRLTTTPSAQGEYFTISKDTGDNGVDQLLLHVCKFSPYAVGENVDSGLTGGNVDVLAQVVEGDRAVYKLDFAWGPMAFAYSTGVTWNPESYQYEQSGTPGWRAADFENGNNEITVTNHSNGDVKVTFQMLQTSLAGVTMAVNSTNADDGTPATGLPLGKVPSIQVDASLLPTLRVYLRLTGAPTNLTETAYTKVGVISATVEAAGGALTPTS